MKRTRKRVAARRLKSIDALIDYLCETWGYCDASYLDFPLPPPPVNEMVDAILRAEGIDPLGYCEHKQMIRAVVEDCYDDMGVSH
jgi:hypothetical protein